MFKRMLNKLEDPNRPFLGPVDKYLSFWGMWLPSGFKRRCFAILLHVLETIFIITEFIDIFCVKGSLHLLLTNLKFSMQGLINICKAWSFIAWQKDWRDVCDYVTRADLANRSGNLKTKNNIAKYTQYCRKVMFIYCQFTFVTAFVVIFQPAFKYLLTSKYRDNVKSGDEKYMQVVSSWVPFNKYEMPGYFFTCLIQGYGTLMAAVWISSYDMIALSVIIYIRAEVEALRIDTADIFNGGVPLRNIEYCHKRHVELLRYSRLFNSCTSPILMLYTFICTVMLCSTAYQITYLESSKMQQLMIVMYLLFGILQLFLYCWHSNEVYYASMELARGPYKSEWWKQNASNQRSIFILVGELSKTIIFTAGPFTNLTVATFINILKGAYSYYTLL
ncbi:unnamed protein product [Leptosia nina]|uniref:Odorant receptor n=1 Tax=Leptosia nina TaxID=320188 RepID=A0AAV1JH88_9NEOP